MKTTLNRFMSALVAMATLTLAGCQKDDPQTQTIDYDNLRFEVTVGEKTDYEGDGPDTRAVKTGWEQDDMILVYFDGSDANTLALIYDTEDGWQQMGSETASLEPEGGKAQVLYADVIAIDQGQWSIVGDMLFTDAGTYTMDGNTVRLTLSMNTRLTSRVTVEGLTGDLWDWALTGPDLSVAISDELPAGAFNENKKWADALPSGFTTDKWNYQARTSLPFTPRRAQPPRR
ncbi:MAG: hypothetical protein LBV47_00885 [Bacteroidales bacterium]|jgi:hypothetical protein|nr:hypothetical protein [Bacteroidales bacterium]